MLISAARRQQLTARVTISRIRQITLWTSYYAELDVYSPEQLAAVRQANVRMFIGFCTRSSVKWRTSTVLCWNGSACLQEALVAEAGVVAAAAAGIGQLPRHDESPSIC